MDKRITKVLAIEEQLRGGIDPIKKLKLREKKKKLIDKMIEDKLKEHE